MGERSFRIRGTPSAAEQPLLYPDSEIRIRAARRLVPGRARDGVIDELEVAANEVVRIELDNGFVLWSRVDDLVREHGRHTLSRDGFETWEFDTFAPRHTAARGERGLVGLGIRVLDFFGIELDKKAARQLGTWFENKKLKAGPPGLYSCSLDDTFSLSPLTAENTPPADQGPLLIFLHGVASNTQGSFGQLWVPDNTCAQAARRRLHSQYGDRAFAFEHCTLTQSPVNNALALAKCLPKQAELHLVSHSRGGLVGELLCLGECENLSRQLTPETLETLFAADRTIAEQLGLGPLDTEEKEERNKAYGQDRKDLAELVKLLAKKSFQVSRFVRTACPVRGSTLASGRLDRWLSMLDFLAGRMLGESLFADGLDFLLAAVKERTDPRTLPGLEAMMPGSALTRLLHHPGLLTTADLSVIAGDIEGDSLWQKLKLLASDWFYGADHDLAVNTGSMSGGLRRPDRGARFRQDKGSEVNHFSYFRNERSLNWLLAALTRQEGEDGGFQPITAAQHAPPRWRAAVDRTSSGTAPRPLAVIIPGFMGSQLKAAGRLIWPDYEALRHGGLQELAMGATDIAAGSLGDELYGPLLDFLGSTHRVRPFAYDWRLSLREAARELAQQLEQWLPEAEREGQPVHLVAHSSGGLVARAMMADGGAGAALWLRIAQLPQSRLLMLGTPNFGSYEAMRWLTGFNPTLVQLSLLDPVHDARDLVNLMRQYPGLLELLPFGPEDPDFADPALWNAIQSNLPDGMPPSSALHARDSNRNPPAPTGLTSARETWRLLRTAKPDPALMRYVAGCQPSTVKSYQFSATESSAAHKRLDFLATPEGDGVVTWASGSLPGVPTWYVDNTAHDALCVQKRAFPAYLDLLQSGTTTRLPSSPPVRHRTATGEPESFILPASPPADGIPSDTTLDSLGFGGKLPDEMHDERPAIRRIEVSICHGDLSYARYPVMVGHYHGDTILSAEHTLDQQLDGALSRRLQLGLYPGRLDTHALFLNRHPNAKPAGAIVVGLGQVGELTPSLLEAGMRSALLDYALQVAQCPDERFGPPDILRHARVSCLLVGTGPGGVTVRDSLETILRAAIATNARLDESDLKACVTLDRLEFLEVYEDAAISAAEALRQILSVGEFASFLHWPAKEVESGRAGRRRVRFDDTSEWWHRLEIVEEEGRRDTLRFIFATDRARAEETLATGQLALAETFIHQASRSPQANPEAARTLHEMLLPLRLRESAPSQTDLVLLVDTCSARYPWEMLENRWSGNERPAAVRAGLIRQLKTLEFRPRPAHAFEPHALVVGSPDLDGWDKFDDLPGARQEALRVAKLLAEHEWQVHECIDAKADEIIASLHRDSWRILHLAGHGVHDYPLPPPLASGSEKQATRPVSGMVIARETFLTPGDIEQMRWVPELVFINCCHLGRTQSSGASDRGELAANLGVQFIRMGVRAVICAGWAVQDAAALAFAETFYASLLDGQTFGESVRAARKEIWSHFPGVNTWGAYQCYGDPSYRLHHHGEPRIRRPLPYSTPTELVVDLDNLAEVLKASGAASKDEAAGKRINDLLERIPEPQRESWTQRADVAAALGFAWGEARSWPEAIEWLGKSLKAPQGNCPIRVIEQLASFRVRRAAEEWLKSRTQDVDEIDSATCKKEIERAISDLEMLCQYVPTAERLSLLGSAHKRLALMQEPTPARLDTLDKMAKAYEQSFKLGGCAEAYAFSNWAIAKVLALRLDTARSDDWRLTLEPECIRLRNKLQENSEYSPTFWNSVGCADLDLVRLLVRSTPSAEALPAGCEALVEQIIKNYCGAIKRGASPREQASVIENLDWLVAFLGVGAGPLTKAVERIRETI